MENAIQELTDVTGGRLDFYNIGGLAMQRTRDSLWGLWNERTPGQRWNRVDNVNYGYTRCKYV